MDDVCFSAVKQNCCGRGAIETLLADEIGCHRRVEKRIPWSAKVKDAVIEVESDSTPRGAHNERLIQSIVRAHAWVHCLRDGAYVSIEHSPRPTVFTPRSFASTSG
jgi:hypothetical protein